jgi:hypothetical protein
MTLNLQQACYDESIPNFSLIFKKGLEPMKYWGVYVLYRFKVKVII